MDDASPNLRWERAFAGGGIAAEAVYARSADDPATETTADPAPDLSAASTDQAVDAARTAFADCHGSPSP